MVSSRIIFQVLLTLGAAVAAPAHYEEDGVYSARELSSSDYLEKRSIMPAHQQYSRDYDLSARDFSPLSVRAGTPSPPPMSATNAEKAKWNRDRIPAAEAAVRAAKDHNNRVKANKQSTKQQKDSAKGQLHTAEEALEGYRENAEHYEDQIRQGHP